MKKTKYMPYCFNVGYEYRTYKKIGKYYKIDNFVGGLFYKVTRKLINIKNKNQKRYKKFHTYSEWKKHAINYLDKIDNKEDFLHFLKMRRDNYQMQMNSVLAIALPIYVCEMGIIVPFFNSLDDVLNSACGLDLTLRMTFISESFAFCIICIIAIYVTSTKLHEYCKNHYFFYRDWIEITEELIKEERNNSL